MKGVWGLKWVYEKYVIKWVMMVVDGRGCDDGGNECHH